MINLHSKDAVKLIAQKIEDREPFVFTRFGDGELHAMRWQKWGVFRRGVANLGLHKGQHPKNMKGNWNKWIEANKEGMKIYQKLIFKALVGVDLFGIGKDDYTDPDMELETGHGWNATEEELIAFGANAEGKYRCSHTLPRFRIMGTMKGMRRILHGTPVHVISPAVKHLKKKELSRRLDAPVGYTEYPRGANLQKIKQLRRELKDSKRIKEPVVLYGVGGPGKHVINQLKNQGKVVLDIGSVLECWGGLVPRAIYAKNARYHYCVVK